MDAINRDDPGYRAFVKGIASQHAELMRFAFNQICNPDDWKGPICATVTWDTANVYMQAVEFMTATKAACERFKDDPRLCNITSPGYRAGPAGP
jgi:hypothetical protein